MARNHAVGEGFRLSTVGDVNLLYYSASYAISEERGEDWLTSWPQRVRELSERLDEQLHPREDVVQAARCLALAELRVRPMAVARVEVKSLFKLFVDHTLGTAASLLGIPYQPSGLFSRLVLRDPGASAGGSWGVLLAALGWMGLNALIAFGALIGLGIALWYRSWALLIAGGVTIVLFAAATGAVGLERMRMPIMLPLLILAGYASSLRKLEPEPLPPTPLH
jgi:hypothetical protein